MKRLCSTTIALAMLCAVPVLAADKWVSPSGTTAWGSANSSATPASLATANANASAGDRVFLLPGTYSTEIAPANSGTSGSRIVFMGANGDTTGVSVTGVNLTASSYVTVKWVRSSGWFTCRSTSLTTYPASDSLYFARFLGGCDISGSHLLVLSRCAFGQGNTLGNGSFVVGMGGGLKRTSRASITDVQVFLGGEAADATNGGGNHAFVAARMMDCSFTRLQMNAYLSATWATGQVPIVIYGMNGCAFTDTRFDLKNVSTIANAYQMYLREGCNFSSFSRCSLTVNPSSTNTTNLTFSASGDSSGPYHQYSLSFDSCYFRATGIARTQSYMRRATFTHNVFDLGGDGLRFNFAGADVEALDSLVFEHNTCYTTSGMFLDQDGTRISNAKIRYNIFALSAATTWSIIDANERDTIDDYNLYYTPTAADSSKCVQPGGGSPIGVGPSSTWCTSDGLGCHSRFANPGFANVANHDFTPAWMGYAHGAAWPDCYVGAVYPQGAVSNLQATAYRNGFTLGWTAPGTNGEAVAQYVIKYSTSVITAANFDGLTTTVTPPTPLAGGMPQTACIDGLPQNTLYYFALKSIDGCGNVSLMSNVISKRTKTTGSSIACSSAKSQPQPDKEPQVSELQLRVAPNPAVDRMRVVLSIPAAYSGSQARVGVYDILGRHVRTLFEGKTEAGEFQLAWDRSTDAGGSVRPGIYFVRIVVADRVLSRAVHVR